MSRELPAYAGILSVPDLTDAARAALFDPAAEPITTFRGEHYALSNFAPTMLFWEGAWYTSSEHAFNAGKTTSPSVRAWIADANGPRQAKQRGNDRARVQLRDGWDDDVRYRVMYSVLSVKFIFDTVSARTLMQTGNRELVEGNAWHDTTWGRCSCPKHQHQGDNALGWTLMLLRAQLRDRGHLRPT